MKKQYFIISGCVLLLAILTSSLFWWPGRSDGITIWVGSESTAFYQKKVDEYLESTGSNAKIIVQGSDIGSNGGVMSSDNTTCADIVSIAHDNIGKLSQSSLIAPIIDKDLLAQIEEDNPESFKQVIKNYLGQKQVEEQYYTFAVPYISQALFLYYDTRYVTPKQAETFEGLEEAAKAYDTEYGVSGTKSFLVTGTDGYNFSFSVLARKDPNGENTETSRIYDGFNQHACYEQSNDQVAVMRWLQRSKNSSNGILLKPGSSWTTVIQEHKALASIGGAWQYNSFKSAVGEDNIGCAIIPTFTLTEADVKGISDVTYPNAEYIPEELRGTVDKAPVKGTVYRGGSFVDCKCFVINQYALNKYNDNGGSDPDGYYKELCDLIRYLSSVEIQKESFVNALNVPAFVGAEEYIASLEGSGKVTASAIEMAKAQTGMNKYGISQPFTTAKLNTYYYQNGAPDTYVGAINDPDYSGADAINTIRSALFKMEYIWRNGKGPKTIPATLPGSSNKQ